METIIELEKDGSRSVGIYKNGAEYIAMTFTNSKTFKTEAGARKWLAANFEA